MYSIDVGFMVLDIDLFFLLGFFVLVGAVSKSAQLGLHT
jgi:NADH:ubiquinone oxidoreductase subunit 5 (subunit L)/multisubunit Na+/H+ antiporter MnhA subunit